MPFLIKKMKICWVSTLWDVSCWFRNGCKCDCELFSKSQQSM